MTSELAKPCVGGSDYAGGSYGGYGGMSSSTNPGEPYGSLFTPTSLGSGGSHGAGGGHMTLEVRVDDLGLRLNGESCSTMF